MLILILIVKNEIVNQQWYFMAKLKEKPMSNLKIFANTIDQKAKDQINELLDQDAFKDCKVRIMPDVHAGAGCVIGFTADLGDKVIPNIVGVDIGCSMLCCNIGNVEIDFDKLDNVIKNNVPSGRNIREDCIESFPELKSMFCYNQLRNRDRFDKSVGTLGGGNHFIEVNVSSNGIVKYLVIHTGSRNVGKQVADYYQNLAIDNLCGKNRLNSLISKMIEEYKFDGREDAIQFAIKELKENFYKSSPEIPKELCYLIGEEREMYLHDMKICQRFALKNKEVIASVICKNMNWGIANEIHTVHNYIEEETNMVRKGAISAKKDEIVIIPINMRDGSIIGVGLGNEDWNYSAPHGAGRLMGRRNAKRTLSLDEYKEEMSGVYTTSVCFDTLDEAPMAYKPIEEIVECIEPTVRVLDIIKPIYNFKAVE